MKAYYRVVQRNVTDLPEELKDIPGLNLLMFYYTIHNTNPNVMLLYISPKEGQNFILTLQGHLKHHFQDTAHSITFLLV